MLEPVVVHAQVEEALRDLALLDGEALAPLVELEFAADEGLAGVVQRRLER